MKKVKIILGKDRHFIRLIQSMQMCDAMINIANDNESDSTRYDITFIDPSIDFDPTPRINSDIITFFDSEDSPYDYNIAKAYDSYQHKVDFYCKMDWVGDKWEDKKLVGFPNPKMLALVPFSTIDVGPYRGGCPVFIGTNTFIGNYKPEIDFCYSERDKVTSLGEINNELVYSQRLDWILSMEEKGIINKSGLVFDDNDSNLSLDWQQKVFGKDVIKYQANRVNLSNYIVNLLYLKIGLNPTGHARNSWRIFDIMCSGAVLFTTDITEYNNLYSPISKVIVKDSESLGDKLNLLKSSMPELYQEARLNREIFQRLTPDIIWDDFIKQFK